MALILDAIGIAKKLSELRNDWHTVQLEADVAETVKLALRGAASATPITRDRGRIDIVLREAAGIRQPKYIIEVKDIIEQFNEAVDDVIRIEEMLLSQGGSYKSSINM